MRRAARIDATAKELTAYARSLGFAVLPINGTIDAVIALGQTCIAVDFKSPGGELTTAQQRLIASGFPLRFVANPAQLDALKAEVLGRDR
jgi:hypothetical protein